MRASLGENEKNNTENPHISYQKLILRWIYGGDGRNNR